MGEIDPFDAEALSQRLHADLRDLRVQKPGERSERARHYAVAITEMEKVVAYFDTYVLRSDVPLGDPTEEH